MPINNDNTCCALLVCGTSFLISSVTGNKPNYYTRSHTRFHHDDLNELVLRALYTQSFHYFVFTWFYPLVLLECFFGSKLQIRGFFRIPSTCICTMAVNITAHVLHNSSTTVDVISPDYFISVVAETIAFFTKSSARSVAFLTFNIRLCSEYLFFPLVSLVFGINSLITITTYLWTQLVGSRYKLGNRQLVEKARNIRIQRFNAP
jgi:hypothetical protein